MLEKIVYNHLEKYLTTLQISYPKQFGFQKGHSTEHTVVKLANQIYESFKRYRTSNVRYQSCLVPLLPSKQKIVYFVR